MAPGRMHFTKQDDDHLLEYIALNCPQEKGRQGPALYRRLTDNTRTWPWAKNHPSQSWLQRYRDRKEYFDEAIYKYLVNKARQEGVEPPPKPTRDPTASPVKTQRRPFSENEDRMLMRYLARAAPTKTKRSGNALYQILVGHPELYPWAQTHPWSSWQQRYKKNEEWFDEAIKRYQRRKGIDPNQAAKAVTKKVSTGKAAAIRKRAPIKKEVNSEGEDRIAPARIGAASKRRRSPEQNDQPAHKKRRLNGSGGEPSRPTRRAMTPAEIVALRQEEEEESQVLDIPSNHQANELPPARRQPPPVNAEAGPSTLRSGRPLRSAPDDDYSQEIFDRESSVESEQEEVEAEVRPIEEQEQEPNKQIDQSARRRSPTLDYVDVEPASRPQRLYPDLANAPSPNLSGSANDITGAYPSTSTPLHTARPQTNTQESQIIPTPDTLAKLAEEQRIAEAGRTKVSQAPTPPTSHAASPRANHHAPTRSRTPQPQVVSEDTAPSTIRTTVKRKRRRILQTKEDWFASSPAPEHSRSASPTPRKRTEPQMTDGEDEFTTPRYQARRPPVLVEGPFTTAFTDAQGGSMFARGKRRRSGVDEDIHASEPEEEGHARQTGESWPPQRSKTKGKEKATAAPLARLRERSPTPRPSTSRLPDYPVQQHHDFSQPTQVQHRTEEPVLPRISDTQRENLARALAMLARPLQKAELAPQELEQEPESVHEPEPEIQAEEEVLPSAPPTSSSVLATAAVTSTEVDSDLSEDNAVENALFPQSGLSSNAISQESQVDNNLRISESQSKRLQDALAMLKGVSKTVAKVVSVEEAHEERLVEDRVNSEMEVVPESPPIASGSASRRETRSPERPAYRSPTVLLPPPGDSSIRSSLSKGKQRAIFPPPPSIIKQRTDRRYTLGGYVTQVEVQQPRDMLRSRFSMPTSRNEFFSISPSLTPTFEGKEVEGRDLTLAMNLALKAIAKNHGFDEEVAHRIWKATGNLEVTDVALKKMRENAQNVGQGVIEDYLEKSTFSEYTPLPGTKSAAVRSLMEDLL
ncbi:unnamed protein product [Somion occarium]|uniref:TERF2-interacting telomeric protein 1 Myb domain-containing protein n=1 Tax=Somion occarium TaxID=3059160 RepID=A0ABP1D5I2_9APHY